MQRNVRIKTKQPQQEGRAYAKKRRNWLVTERGKNEIEPDYVRFVSVRRA